MGMGKRTKVYHHKRATHSHTVAGCLANNFTGWTRHMMTLRTFQSSQFNQTQTEREELLIINICAPSFDSIFTSNDISCHENRHPVTDGPYKTKINAF